MPHSLRAQIFFALAITMLSSMALVAIEEFNRARLATRFSDIHAAREHLDGALWRIEDRHIRAMRRCRDALIDPKQANTPAMLAYTAQHYLQDMERAITDGGQGVQAIAVTDADSRFQDDLGRLQKQLDRLLMEAQNLVPTLENLVDASQSNDIAALAQAQQALERGDRTIAALLRITQGMVRSTVSWQASRATAPPLALSSSVWAAMTLVWLASFWLADLPQRRLRKLAIEGAAHGARPRLGLFGLSREQAMLHQRFSQYETEKIEALARLAERSREAERAQMVARRSEHELALLRFYNENLVNSLRAAIVVTDANGQITSVNRVARALLGIDDASVGQPVAHSPLYNAVLARAPSLASDLGAAMQARRALRYEAVSYGATTPILLDLTIAPYQDETGAARGLLWVADDVTDTVHIKHQLLQAERLAAVGRLSAQVAHEIRNPLSAIGLNAEILEEEFLTHLSPQQGAEARQLLGAIAAEIERLTAVTETYLHLARLPRPQTRRIDINALINDLFVMLAEEMKAHKIQVHMHLSTPSPQSVVDPGQLRQALLNIVRNSREAMSEGGTLHIVTQAITGGCRIKVTDTGPGMAPAVLQRVFEPFYSTKPHGTGLGLSLTQQIIAEHGGTIALKSDLGRGTELILTLPDSVDAAANSGD